MTRNEVIALARKFAQEDRWILRRTLVSVSLLYARGTTARSRPLALKLPENGSSNMNGSRPHKRYVLQSSKHATS